MDTCLGQSVLRPLSHSESLSSIFCCTVEADIPEMGDFCPSVWGLVLQPYDIGEYAYLVLSGLSVCAVNGKAGYRREPPRIPQVCYNTCFENVNLFQCDWYIWEQFEHKAHFGCLCAILSTRNVR